MLLQLCLAVASALVISALCSFCEAILYAVPLSHIEMLAQQGKPSGILLKKLRSNIHRPIVAILTLNTIANTMGASVAGASATGVFGQENLVWFTTVFTFSILLFSEILPKTVGVAYAKNLAPLIAFPVRWLVFALSPLIWLSQAVTGLIPKSGQEALATAEEVRAIAMLSRKSGGIDPQQEKVITNILELRQKTVRQVMTPRTVTFLLSEHMTVAEAHEMEDKWSRHSRVPVYDTDSDDIVGIVLRKDVMMHLAAGDLDLKLTAIMQPVHFVPEAAPLNKVLLDFFERHQHLFVVVDEYGSVTGVISMEDIIEEIVGLEIVDETDQASSMREYARLKRQSLRR